MSVFDRLENWKWRFLKYSGLTNVRVDRILRRADDEAILGLGVPVAILDITAQDYRQALDSPRLAFYRSFPFPHRKLLEYISSVKLSAPLADIACFCDFAGGMDPFAAWARDCRAHDARVYAVDPSLTNNTMEGVILVRGDARGIDLPDASLDWITCHHAIEHFREDMDTAAVKEFVRVLKPGGIAVITPIFLVNQYAEIWNALPADSLTYDPLARRIIDRTSPFPGWSEFEHFARAYDVSAFTERVLPFLTAKGSVELFEVTYDGGSCPDVSKNKGLPAFCQRMLALRFRKFTTS